VFRRVLACFVVSFLVFVGGTGAESAVGASTQPWVVTQGTAFVRSVGGQPIVLRGANVAAGNWLGMEQATMALGANFVRIRVAWSEVEPAAPVNGAHTWNQTLLANLDKEVAWYAAHGVSVLIDFHQFKWSTYFSGSGAQGVPSWFYSQVHAGTYATTQVGLDQAMGLDDRLGRTVRLPGVRADDGGSLRGGSQRGWV
jgi:Cellulase (glycosyl hydrolase family 5)